MSRLEYLNICGDAKVEKEACAVFQEKLTEISGAIKVIKGRVLEGKMSLRISGWMLEQEPDGIHVADCMKVKLDEDIPNELIMKRLGINDCMEVICTEEQEPAVSMVCEEVMHVGPKTEDDEEDSMGIGSMVKNALNGAKELLETKVINAADYVL